MKVFLFIVFVCIFIVAIEHIKRTGSDFKD